MVDPKDAARRDLARIDAQIAELRAERSRVAGFIDMYDRYANVAKQDTAKVTKKDQITNLTIDLIRTEGGFAQISKIVEEVKLADIDLPGDDERQHRAYIASVLTRDERLVHVHGRGWGMRSGLSVLNTEEDDRPEAHAPSLSRVSQ